MRGLWVLVCGVALAASAGVSSAAAANWDPVNTTLHGSQVGTGRLTTNTGGVWACTAATTDLRAASATPSVASTVSTTNPVAISGCTANGFASTMTTHGTWDFTATSTTNVNITARPTVAGGAVWTWNIPALGCSLVINEITIAGNTWNNINKTLTLNGAASFPLVANTEACGTFIGTSATYEGTFNIPGENLT